MEEHMQYVDIEEQETHISYMRDEDFAYLYTTDKTTMTKMDKKVKANPGLFTVTQNDISKTYKFPKKLISIRAKFKEISDEQRKAIGDRLRQYRDSQND